MKRVVAVLMLALLGAHLVGSYVYFVIRAAEIKREMRATLRATPAEELDMLVMTRAEFDAAREDEHEIKWQGRMYDVARVEPVAGQVVVYALHDEAEDNLLAFLDAVLKNSAGDKKPVPDSLFSWLSLKYMSPVVVTVNPGPSTLKPFTPYYETFSELARTIVSPPPRS